MAKTAVSINQRIKTLKITSVITSISAFDLFHAKTFSFPFIYCRRQISECKG